MHSCVFGKRNLGASRCCNCFCSLLQTIRRINIGEIVVSVGEDIHALNKGLGIHKVKYLKNQHFESLPLKRDCIVLARLFRQNEIEYTICMNIKRKLFMNSVWALSVVNHNGSTFHFLPGNISHIQELVKLKSFSMVHFRNSSRFCFFIIFSFTIPGREKGLIWCD